jgi:hypothetical protein
MRRESINRVQEALSQVRRLDQIVSDTTKYYMRSNQMINQNKNCNLILIYEYKTTGHPCWTDSLGEPAEVMRLETDATEGGMTSSRSGVSQPDIWSLPSDKYGWIKRSFYIYQGGCRQCGRESAPAWRLRAYCDDDCMLMSG